MPTEHKSHYRMWRLGIRFQQHTNWFLPSTLFRPQRAEAPMVPLFALVGEHEWALAHGTIPRNVPQFSNHQSRRPFIC
jgi:hypothetical protein